MPLTGTVSSALLLIASAAAAHPAMKHYINDNWGYSVSLPASVRYEMAPSPAPNHGFDIMISKDAYVWVDGSSSDAETLEEAASDELHIWAEEGCALKAISPTLLGGTSARRAVLKCWDKDHGATNRVELFALGSPLGYGNSLYTVGATYVEGSRDAGRALAAFEVVRRGFRFEATEDLSRSDHSQ